METLKRVRNIGNCRRINCLVCIEIFSIPERAMSFFCVFDKLDIIYSGRMSRAACSGNKWKKSACDTTTNRNFGCSSLGYCWRSCEKQVSAAVLVKRIWSDVLSDIPEKCFYERGPVVYTCVTAVLWQRGVSSIF